jgi:hypothetical protein
MSALDDRLLPVFTRNHWLVSFQDVLDAGGRRHHVDHRLAIGRWEAVQPLVYRLCGTPMTWHGRLLAPILSAGPPGMATHFAAGALHQIPGIGMGTPELSIPRGTRLDRTGITVHTSTDLDRCGRLLIDAVPTTDFARTVLDVARRLGDERVLRAIEFGRRSGKTDWADLIRTLRRHARRGRPGVARLRRVITANAHRDEITDSDLELLVIALLIEHGLPEPVLHHRIFDGNRFVAEVDLAYPDLKIAIELDGRIHLDPDVHERDLPRQNDLILEGWTVLRFTWRRLQERPESIVAEVRAALRRRASAQL